MSIILNTERLKLRPYQLSDYEEAVSLFSQEQVCRYMLYHAWQAENYQANFGERLANNSLSRGNSVNLAIIYQNKMIGDIGLTKTEIPSCYEIDYVLKPEFTAKGLATEAVRTIMAYVFNTIKAHRLIAHLDARNIASARLCERVGMRKEGHFIQNFWTKGEWTDSIIYGLLWSEFQLNH